MAAGLMRLDIIIIHTEGIRGIYQISASRVYHINAGLPVEQCAVITTATAGVAGHHGLPYLPYLIKLYSTFTTSTAEVAGHHCLPYLVKR